MRVVIDCDASDFDAAVRLLREEFRDWERRYDKPGWGWSYPLADGTRCFIRRIKGGLSLKQIRPAISSHTQDGSDD